MAADNTNQFFEGEHDVANQPEHQMDGDFRRRIMGWQAGPNPTGQKGSMQRNQTLLTAGVGDAYVRIINQPTSGFSDRRSAGN